LEKATVDTSRLLISICRLSKIAGVALDVIGRQSLRLFHHANISEFRVTLAGLLLHPPSLEPDRAIQSITREQGLPTVTVLSRFQMDRE
jgi:hypothetical protein